MSDGIKSYRDLKVWQKAVDLVPAVYEIVKVFPKHEEFALSGQVRRAVVSIATNIAEGQARHHRKEFVQGLYIARGSVAELDTLFVVAERLGYLKSGEAGKVTERLFEVQRMVQGLITALLATSR